jgi:hypothetical protein
MSLRDKRSVTSHTCSICLLYLLHLFPGLLAELLDRLAPPRKQSRLETTRNFDSLLVVVLLIIIQEEKRKTTTAFVQSSEAQHRAGTLDGKHTWP